MPTYSQLNKGLNLWGWSSSVNMEPGEALDAKDVLFRNDGAVQKHYGWTRVPITVSEALPSRGVALKSFTYKGKNSDQARTGNLGIANDGGSALHTRRAALYTGAIALTATQAQLYDGAGPSYWDAIALPGGVNIGINAKPTVLVLQNNVYIFGWADANLRYDPVDRALYVMGWDNLPANAGHTGLQAGGTLIPGKVYRYRLAWVDMLTGEESGLSAEYAVTTTAANRTVLLDNFVAYAGTRHFVDAVNVDNNDVGIVVYRSGPNNASAYYFLDLIAPGVAAKSVTDNGLATDNTLRADVRTYEDLPRLDAAIHYRSMLLGFSWEAPPEPADDGRQPQFQGSSARIYYNDFRGEKSFLERWDVRNYKEIPLEDGEVFTALCPHALGVTLFSNNKTYDMQVRPLQSGRTDVQINPMYWTVGCVGPRAQQYVEGWVYWISDRGPYRWRPGALDPQFIGRNIQPMFIDPESGICKLNEQASAESEVFYDQDADVVRFAFPTGPWGGFINRHLMYNPRAVEYGLKFYQSWSMSSATAQTFDRGIYEPFIDGVPADPLEFRARSCFIDKHNYVMRFEPDSTRTNVSPSEVLTGTVQAASTTTLLRILGGLITTSLVGGMAEVVFSDGTAEVREIIANSATTISVDHPFSQDPIGATWYACGIHAIWRSWVDTVGNPAAHKDLTHLHVGYNTEFPTSGFVVDVNVSAAYEWPTTSQRSRTADLSLNREKMLIARVGRFWTYEFANTRPDEKMLITWFKADHKELSERT